METLRLRIQTLAPALVAGGLLVHALRATPEALAAASAECRMVDSGKMLWEKAGEDMVAQTTAMRNARGDREHVAILPFGRMASGSGGIYSVVYLW